MAERLDDCRGNASLAHCAMKKRLQRKMTERTTIRTGAQQNLGMFNKSWNDCTSLNHLSVLKDQIGLRSINCHIHVMMTGNCSETLRVLANSLRVVSVVMTRNPPQSNNERRINSNSGQWALRTFRIQRIRMSIGQFLPIKVFFIKVSN